MLAGTNFLNVALDAAAQTGLSKDRVFAFDGRTTGK